MLDGSWEATFSCPPTVEKPPSSTACVPVSPATRSGKGLASLSDNEIFELVMSGDLAAHTLERTLNVCVLFSLYHIGFLTFVVIGS